MVHALRQIWRVLAPGGLLLDMRPRPQSCPVEVLRGPRATVVGTIAENPAFVADDRASDAAIHHMVREGWFTLQRSSHFEFSYYWDSVDDMERFVEANWRRRHVMRSETLEAARRRMASAGRSPRLRCRARIMLSVYQRTTGPWI